MSGGGVVTLNWASILANQSTKGGAAIVTGNNSINNFSSFDSMNLGVGSINAVKVIFTGSGGIGNIEIDPGTRITSVPEPGTVGLVLVGLSLIGLARRKKL